MPIKPFFLLVMFLGVYLPPAFAALPAAVSASGDAGFVPPVPITVVPPMRAPAGYENASVDLKLVVDVRGLPQCVDPVGLVPSEVRELVVSAVKKWKFRPATSHGIPVSVCVILPLRLAVSP